MTKTKISLETKLRALQLVEEGLLSRADIARQLSINTATLKTIIRRRDAIRGAGESLLAKRTPTYRYRMKPSATINRMTYEWLMRVQASSIPVTGPMIRAKALEFAAMTRQQRPRHARRFLATFTASSGWLRGFKDEYGLSERRYSGEGQSADVAGINRAREQLPDLISGYGVANVYNADETGLVYEALPGRTIADRALTGQRQSKKRATVLLCSNATGSDKLPPLVIGRSRQPRCFRGAQRPANYRHQEHSWMDGAIFADWLRDLDAHVARPVLLLLDNAAPHRVVIDPPLTNVRVEFLPPNTTSAVQPCDAGIIRSFKSYWRNEFVGRLLQAIARNEDPTSKMNMLEVCHVVNSAWSKVTAATIRHCWVHTRILGPDESEQLLAGTPPIGPCPLPPRTPLPEGAPPALARLVEGLDADQPVATNLLPADQSIVDHVLSSIPEDSDSGDDSGTYPSILNEAPQIDPEPVLSQIRIEAAAVLSPPSYTSFLDSLDRVASRLPSSQ